MRDLQIVLRCVAVLAISSCLPVLLPTYAGTLGDVELDLTLLIENPIQTVGPNENILINVMLTNELSSPGSFDGSAASQYIVNGTLLDLSPGAGNPYNVDFGDTSLIFLSPGESTSFTFITLIPDPAPVAPGNYASSGLGFDYSVGGSQFSVSSTSGIDITVVPEPASVALACLAGLAIVFRRLR